MNEQRNLYLAIGLSIAIILFLAIYFPSQPIVPPTPVDDEVIKPADSIEDKNDDILEIKPRNEVEYSNKAIIIIELVK